MTSNVILVTQTQSSSRQGKVAKSEADSGNFESVLENYAGSRMTLAKLGQSNSTGAMGTGKADSKGSSDENPDRLDCDQQKKIPTKSKIDPSGSEQVGFVLFPYQCPGRELAINGLNMNGVMRHGQQTLSEKTGRGDLESRLSYLQSKENADHSSGDVLTTGSRRALGISVETINFRAPENKSDNKVIGFSTLATENINFKPDEFDFELIGPINVSRLTEAIIQIASSDFGQDMAAVYQSGFVKLHDSNLQTGMKFIRLHLQPESLGQLTLCLRNEADGLSIVVQTPAIEIHEKLVAEKDQIVRELNELGILTSDIQIRLNESHDAQFATPMHGSPHRGAFERKYPERENSKQDAPNQSGPEREAAVILSEKGNGTYI